MTESEKKFYEMTRTPLRRQIIRLAVPVMICMLMNTIYNTADTYFVGRLGKAATGAVGIAYPAMNMITAIGHALGNGGGTSVAGSLGSRDRTMASRAATTTLFICLLISLVIGLTGCMFRDRLAFLLGATETIAPLAADYLKFILLGMVFETSSQAMNYLLRFQGNPGLAMVALLSGGFLNLLLDPLLIFTFHMGVAGAALATALSQTFSFAFLLILCLRSGVVELKWKHLYFDPALFRAIFRIGTPTFVRQLLNSLSTVILNFAARPYGDAGIAAVTIVSRVTFFCMSLILGFHQGFQPFCAFNYGAKQYRRVYRGLLFTLRLCFSALCLIGLVGFVFAGPAAGLFTKDGEVQALAALGMRLSLPTIPFVASMIGLDMVFQTLGHVGKNLLLALLRQGGFLLLFALVFPMIWQFLGVQLAQPCGEMSSFIFALLLFRAPLKSLKNLADRDTGTGGEPDANDAA